MNRLHAGIEVVFAAFFGQFTASLLWVMLGSPGNPLESSRSVFAFLLIEAGLTLAVIAWLLRLNGQKWSRIGWHRQGMARGILAGAAVVPFLFVTAHLVISVFSSLFPDLASETNPLLELIRNREDLALFLMTSLLVGGLKEEVQRAFVLNRFESNLGGAWLGLLLWSLFFGAMHLTQGLDRAVAAGFLGLIFGLLYLWRRSLAAPVCAHGLYDMAVVLLTWFGARP